MSFHNSRGVVKHPCLVVFSLACALAFAATLPSPAAETTNSPALRQIIVVFKTHFDIGFTDMASNIVQRYRTSFMDRALEAVDKNRGMPPAQQFVWTIPGWPAVKMAEDWPGQTSARKQRIEEAFQQGRFVVHALPFTTHTELLEAEDMVRGLSYSSGLSRRMGLPLPRDAKMTDVPEHTWMLSTLLKHAGIDFMVIGCNTGSAALRVPWLFWWQGPDGSRTLTLYSPHYGTELRPPPDWPYHTWLAVLHTGDNQGPPKPETVKQVLDQAGREFPGVKVRIGRMSDFADAILADKPDLPIVRGDAPDTWIHGPMSDPAGARLARHTRPLIPISEGLNTQLRAWGVPVADVEPVVSAAYEQSLLYGEHTWGGSISWINRRLSYGEAFFKERAEGRFQRLESSWDEHTGYIQKARALIAPVLATNLDALAQGVHVQGRRIVVYNPLPWMRDGLVALPWKGAAPATLRPADGSSSLPVESTTGELRFVAHDLPPMGYRTYIEGSAQESPKSPTPQPEILESPFFRATFDPARGTVRSLVEKRSGRELVDDSAEVGFGQYLYERFDHDQVWGWADAYLKPERKKSDAYHKPGLPPADQYPYCAASPTGFRLRFEQTPLAVSAVMEAAGGTNHLPRAITTRLVLYRDLPYADLEITLHDKPLEPWPEAGWLCLPFKVSNPQFHLGRLGSIIDPAKDVLPGANRYLFGINSGFAIADPQGRGVGVCPLDSPLVSLDQPGGWKYSLDFVPRRPRAYLNLFNNQWSTNFRFWNEGTWSYRVRLWAIDQYAAEPALITPAEEARFPLQAAFAQGTAGNLPPNQPGLALSSKGVLVTAFGPNPDGTGTLLRLWEYAGRSGACQVQLPPSLKITRVQPVNLRGQKEGQPLHLRNHAFEFNLEAFAPATFLLLQDGA